jgi:hypothetical protein
VYPVFMAPPKRQPSKRSNRKRTQRFADSSGGTKVDAGGATGVAGQARTADPRSRSGKPAGSREASTETLNEANERHLSRDDQESPKPSLTDWIGIGLGVFCVIGFIATTWRDQRILGLTFALTIDVLFVFLVARAKTIKIRVLGVVAAVVVTASALIIPSLKVSPQPVAVDLQESFTWRVGGKSLDYIPLVDDPARGDVVAKLSSQFYSFNVECWTEGVLNDTSAHIKRARVVWAKIVSGSNVGLWIPLGVVATDNPGVALSIPNCNSWQVRL